MGTSSKVAIISGDQPRAFNFGNMTAQTPFTTINQASLPLYKESPYSTFQAILRGTGAVSATVTIKVSNDDNTGRGYSFNTDNASGTPVGTTITSTTLTSGKQDFTQAIVGFMISAPGVPPGTTVASVTNAGTLVMSANATATQANVQAQFFDNAWVNTAAGTITLNGTTLASDGFTTLSAWRYVQAIVSAITGTNATLNVTMGV